MFDLPIKYLIVVKPTAGMKVLDAPAPEGQGANKRRSEPKGRVLHAYDVINFQGVPYAWLVPNDPNKPEWMRVSEAGQEELYCKTVRITSVADSATPTPESVALNRVADGLFAIASALASKVIK